MNLAYAASAGANVERFEANAGRQPGDPDRAARAVLDLADMAQPPTVLVLGSDAVERGRKALSRGLDMIEAHERLARSTDFDKEVTQ